MFQKHKHKHRWHTDRPVVLKDDSKKDIVISDDTHHQELILPKETKQDTNVNLAFDILTPTSIKKGEKSIKKEKTNYNVFLDQEAISFDSSSKHNEVESGNKDVLWHNLYEIKEPDNEVPGKVVKNKEPAPTVNNGVKAKETTTQNVREPNEGKVQNYNIQQTASQIEDSQKDQTSSNIDDSVVSNDNLDVDDSDEDEDEDGIEDDYDDYEDYNYFDKDEEENDENEVQTKEKNTQSDETDVKENVLSLDSDVRPKSFEDLINEIYGGVLPYSASVESIKEQMKENHQKGTTHQVVKKDRAEERVDENENLPVVAKKGNAEESVDENEHLPVVKKDNAEERVDENEPLPVVAKKGKLENANKEKFDASKSKEDSNVINLSDNKKIVFHQDMLESFDEVEDDDNSKTTAMSTKTSITATPLRLSTTAKPPRSSTTTKSPKSSSSNQVLAVNSQSQFSKFEKASEKPEPTKTSKINPSFKTPNAAETSPNPPTTKAVAVTAAPVRGVKEFIQSKPLRKYITDYIFWLLIG